VSKKDSKRLDIEPGESYDVGVKTMKLMNVSEYLETRYTPNSRPSPKRIVKLIREGNIPGIRQGKLYYVDIEQEKLRTGNSLVDSIL